MTNKEILNQDIPYAKIANDIMSEKPLSESSKEILEKATQKAIIPTSDNSVQWKYIGWTNDKYAICSNGEVSGTRGTLKPYLDRKGYWRVSLNFKMGEVWKSKQVLVHRLLAEAFIPNLHELPYINHKNGTRSDNRLSNLEWCTPQENVRDGWKRGRVAWNKNLKSTQNMNLDDLARELPRLQELAKALWGEANKWNNKQLEEKFNPTHIDEAYWPLWKYNLQQMVIADDPISYLGDHLDA